MKGRRNPFVAREGIPFVVLAVIAVAIALRYLDPAYVAAAGAVLVAVLLAFRDPLRVIPASPLGVVSPVDGRVVEVDLVDKGVLHGEGHRVLIRIDNFGTYTARSPIEGNIMDLHSGAAEKTVDYRTNALWIQSDEGEDVVLQFSGFRFGLAPRSFIGFGERVGQGQRCAYLRLARFAELHLPIDSKVLVNKGQSVIAGIDLIGRVPHP